MAKRVPRFIAEQYKGGSHGFRRSKRVLIRKIETQLKELRMGAAYFTEQGYRDFKMITDLVQRLKRELSTRTWGK